jgi:hypothetical protein
MAQTSLHHLGIGVWLVTALVRAGAQGSVDLPAGVQAVWDLDRAHREATPTRERVCLNGLWLWQPAANEATGAPADEWGYFKVPGCWPGHQDWLQKDCQTLFSHPAWAGTDLGALTAAWYQREVTLPAEWTGRRLTLRADYVNSYAGVYVDGAKVGEVLFPGGEVDLSAALRPGRTHTLSLHVVAMPLRGVMRSYSDTAAVKEVAASVARRGLCGDLYLCGEPTGPRVGEVRVTTSVARAEVTFGTALQGLAPDASYALQVRVTEEGRLVRECTSPSFRGSEARNDRFAFTEKWLPPKLWDIHTPGNQYDVGVSLLSSDAQVLDAAYPTRTGFREFRIEGRDFYLNGTRLFLSGVPLDNAQIGAAWASHAGARESLQRLKSFGINFVYTHNYDCQPGSYLSFVEELRAADDEGVLVALSQPHFGDYEWEAADADQANGYARHAEYFVRAAENHPSVVMYSMSHNATGYSEDMSPDLMDGVADPRESWGRRNAQLALRAEAIVKAMDPDRIVYHHSSGNLGSMHTSNFYTNFAPIQELSEWFGPWAAKGTKPVFTCEYMVPCTWDWTMYRGWYKGAREFGSAVVPWEFCIAEWNSQFLGDAAFRISEPEKQNLRWEAEQFRAGRLWHRWDYPYEVGSEAFDERYPVIAAYLNDNWPAFRTWGVSANSPWEWGHYWKPREGVSRARRELPVDWQNLQRPGFSPDYIDQQYERIDLAFKREDWVATPAAQALYRNNMPLLAYLAGKPAAFTSQDHCFLSGETVEKQLVVINNSREPVTAACRWSLALPTPLKGSREVSLPTGQQERVPLSLDLPADLAPGAYDLTATVAFSTGETQEDAFTLRVLARPPAVPAGGKIALFDPSGETAKLLAGLGVQCQPVEANADLAAYDTLVIGKQALTVDGPAPNLARVRDGLKVIVFEQSSAVLEQRLGFRIEEYGLRQAFRRVSDHPLLAGLDEETLRDWRGEATLLPSRLDYELSPRLAYVPAVKWCGLEVSRVWRCGNRGNVASVLIEKPARGDFLPILDGGYSLQYSPLLEYREGKGMVLFCQMDVTGRTESDPAADTLARNILRHVADWKPASRRQTVFCVGEPEGPGLLSAMGLTPTAYGGAALSPRDLLVVGPGGSQALGANKAAVADFLKAGGSLLALGLDEAEANAFLPTPVGTTSAEHIAAYFDPPASGSPFAGLGPADVHNRAPQELPLVTSGAAALGDGVLAATADGRVVLCQLVPYRIDPSGGAVASFTVDAQEAAEGTRSALVTMGAATGAGGQFGQGVKFEPQVGKAYTFAVRVKARGGPVTMHLEVERAGRPWDRAVRAPDVTVPPEEWTDLHATFTCEKPFPEGWQAYIGCSQMGARFRADAFRLYEGDYAPGPAGAAPQNLMTNPGFEDGEKPWFFMFHEQQNRRRTFRRSAFLVNRLLANMGAAGETPLLSRFATPVGEAEGGTGPGASVLRNGDLGLDADGDGQADDWSFSSDSTEGTWTREQAPEGGWTAKLALPGYGGKDQASVMLAQHEVPMQAGQWYRLSLRARAEGFGGKRVTLAIQSTETWTPFFEYQYFAPTEEWRTFRFVVQADRTAEAKTRFQIWHGSLGTLWLADLAMQPIAAPPTEGRWFQGLYLDQPTEWDDPYRFFRW